MDAANGLIVILIWGGLNALIASKRKRSGLIFFVSSVFPVLPFAAVVGWLTKEPNLMNYAAFLPAAVSSIAAIAVPNGIDASVRSGRGNYMSCVFCAEPVRREAVKCRHCGSDLPAKKAV